MLILEQIKEDKSLWSSFMPYGTKAPGSLRRFLTPPLIFQFIQSLISDTL